MTWIEPRTAVAAAEVAAHYDREDPLFRGLWGDHLHHGIPTRGGHTARAVAALERMIAPLELRAGERLLDIGCGYGGPAVHLARTRGLLVTGITLSSRQAHRARELSALASPEQAPRILVGDWLSNDLATASFEAVLSVECFEHVVDKRRFLEEVRRVLVPGGRAVLAVWAAAEEPSERDRRTLLEPICAEARLPSIGSRAAIGRLAEEAGLATESCEDWSRDVLATWPRAMAKTLWLAAARRDVRRRVAGLDGGPRTAARTPLRMIRALRSGTLRYLVLRLR